MEEELTKIKFENKQLKEENKKLKKQLYDANYKLNSTVNRLNGLTKKYNDYVKNENERIQLIVDKAVNEAVNKVSATLKKEYKEKEKELNKEITKLKKMLKTDSSNSSLPTSKNRINVSITNSREKSDKKIGGQKGHKKHKLNYFKEEEIDETIEHTLESCTNCGGNLKETNVVISDIIDLKVKVVRTRNNIHNYVCENCHKRISANDTLPRAASYGPEVNTTAIVLMNESNVAINKVAKYISGISDGQINASEGYLSKIQKQTSKKLESFTEELKNKITTLDVVHWDDTTAKIQKTEVDKKNNKKTSEGILRFYGNDNYALLIGHENKKKEGIEADGILSKLSKNTICMHDHVLLNYNDNYKFKNAECNAHILRYLKAVKDNLHDHKWQDEMAELLKKANEKRKEIIKENAGIANIGFNSEYENEVYKKYDEIIQKACMENAKTEDYHFYKDEELKLIKRLEKFKENHLLFIKDFSVPFTNNTAERGIRKCKRKLAVSFLFKNIESLKDYARIQSYLETCYRNGVSKYSAVKRLLLNNPYTLEELDNPENKN